MRKHQFTIPTEDGLSIGVTEWTPDMGEGLPIVLVLPGLKGFTNWGSFPYICERYCDSGHATFCVDFSRNGVENFGSDITRIDLAEKDSLSRQVEEAQLVFQTITQGQVPECKRLDTSRISVMGHSLGGLVAILFAQNNPDVNKVILWSSISHLDLWPDEVVEDWEEKGRYNMPNTRTGQDFFLGENFLRDVKTFNRAVVQETVQGLSGSVLIVQGEQDTSVPIEQAKELYEWCGEEKAELIIIPRGDHNFGAVHPFQGTTPELETAIKETVEFLKE